VDHPDERLFHLTREEPRPWDNGSAELRRRWLRRLLVMLGASCLAFSLTSLWLSHLAQRTSIQDADSQAVNVVRAHFAALYRGDFQAAYALFSTRLRREMSFEEFQDVMQAHLPLLQGKVSVFPATASARRVVVDIDLQGGRHIDLTAEFTVVRSDGRWWIDGVHWNLNRVRPQRVTYT